MARRRGLTFRTFLRRRWRIASLAILLMAGTLLVEAASNKGHDPQWLRRDGHVIALAVSPPGSTVYTAIGEPDAIRAVRAIDPAGNLRWFHEINVTGVLMAAGDGWVAIATPFPGAELTVWRESDGALLYRDFIQGNPRALAARGDHLALALQAPSNPVLLFEDLGLKESLTFPSFVISLALTPEGRLAAGTQGGEVRVWDQGEDVLNTSRPMRVQSLRLSDDGTKLLIGGFSLITGDISGSAEFFDLGNAVPGVPLWSYPTPVGVGFVDLSLDGARAVAVEERAPRYRVHYFDTQDPRPRWTYEVPGIVARDASGAVGGVALAPDGSAVAASPIERGGIVLLRPEGAGAKAVWRYASEGATLVTFAKDNPERFASNARVLPFHPYDGTALFDVEREPFTERFPHFALLLVALEGGIGLAILGAGYVWEKRRK